MSATTRQINKINKDLQPEEHNTTWVMAFGWKQKQTMVGLSNDALIKKFGGVVEFQESATRQARSQL